MNHDDKGDTFPVDRSVDEVQVGESLGAMANPLDQEAPTTTGIKPAALLGSVAPVRQPVSRTARSTTAPPPPPPTTGPDLPSVEIIRGDKRTREVVRQEQQ